MHMRTCSACIKGDILFPPGYMEDRPAACFALVAHDEGQLSVHGGRPQVHALGQAVLRYHIPVASQGYLACEVVSFWHLHMAKCRLSTRASFLSLSIILP